MNFELRKIDINTDLEKICQLWNAEYEFIYPITLELLQRNIGNALEDACLVAISDGNYVGFIIGKDFNEDFKIGNYHELGWISLIYVAPKNRKQGIGTLLLNKVLDVFKKLGKVTVNLGRDIRNFFPGLPCDLQNFLKWFEDRGFDCSGQTYDVIRRNDGHLPAQELELKNKDYTFRLCTLADKDNLLAFLNECWPGRWTYEAIEYFKLGGNGNEYLICLNKDNQICAFSKVCFPTTLENHISNTLTWRNRFNSLGGIGPLGVSHSYRKRQLGYDIVAAAFNILLKENVSEIIIDWTGLLEFYRKMGFEVWKSYFYLSKNL